MTSSATLLNEATGLAETLLELVPIEAIDDSFDLDSLVQAVRARLSPERAMLVSIMVGALKSIRPETDNGSLVTALLAAMRRAARIFRSARSELDQLALQISLRDRILEIRKAGDANEFARQLGLMSGEDRALLLQLIVLPTELSAYVERRAASAEELV